MDNITVSWDTTFAILGGASQSGVMLVHSSAFSSLQQALDFIESQGGGTVIFDSSSTISSTVYIPSRTTLIGDGTSVLTADPALGFDQVSRCMLLTKSYPNGTPAFGIRVENMILDANDAGSAPNNRVHGIVMKMCHDFKVLRNRVRNCTGYGIWAQGDPNGTPESKFGVIAENFVLNCQVGIETMDAFGIAIRDNSVVCVPGRTLSGIHPWRSERISVRGNVVEVSGSGFQGAGIDVTNCRHIHFGHNDVHITGNLASGTALLIQGDGAGSCSHITCEGGYYYSEGHYAVMIVENIAPADFENIAFNGTHIDGRIIGLQLLFNNRRVKHVRVRDSYVKGRSTTSQACWGIWWRDGVQDISVEGSDVIADGAPGNEYPLVKYRAHRLHNNRFDPDPGPIATLAVLKNYQAIPSGVYTAIEFDSVQYNAFAGFYLLEPTRLTVPTEVTRVILSGQVALSQNQVGSRGIRLTKNGAAHVPGCAVQQIPSAGDQVYSVLSVRSPILAVKPGDYFELQAFQDSGNTLNAGPNNTWFAIEPA
jgi:hypothetical protein